MLYDTHEQAQAEIQDFMEEFGEEDANGDGGYDEEEFIIVPVPREPNDEKAKEK